MRIYFAFLLLFAFSFAYGQGNYHVTNYSLVINGTSNLHAWQSKANEVRAYGTLQADATSLKTIQSLSVEIPVKSIKSAKGSIMDNKTYDALKANNFPNISYKLEKVVSLNSKNGGIELNASGSLTIAGVTKKIDLYVQGWLTADGTITFKGSKKFKMSDFGISPPTALMGTLTTGDEVEIVFQVSLKQ
ncbi:MAG: YceI family protein [Chitinophagales bacterium]|nr:YceI family protein [Chitinophagales bacterium]